MNSRITSKEGLSFIGFNKRELIKEHPKVHEFYEAIKKNPALPSDELPVNLVLCFDSLSDHDLFEIEKCCKQFFHNISSNKSHEK